MKSAARAQAMTERFETLFALSPELWVRAPGRVDVMGSHTDYNGGFVLTAPIDRDTWLAARPRDDGLFRVASLNLEGGAEFRCGAAEQVSGWPLYLQGVAEMFQRAGHAVQGADILVHGTLPLGSGLSSSASIEAAMALLLCELAEVAMSGVAMSQLCQRAENDIVGVPCGILDQYSVILGEKQHLLLLDCRELSHRQVPLPESLALVVCNTRSPRQLLGSQYDARRRACEEGAAVLAQTLPGVRSLRDVSPSQFESQRQHLEPQVARCCEFVIAENARVHALAVALQRDDLARIASLCAESFAGARDLFEMITGPMQAMYAAGLSAPGVVAMRQAGGGFGGCLLGLVDAARVTDFCVAADAAYAQSSGLQGEFYPVSTAAGAGVLSLQAG
ncbi:MAG: galactokinase [Halioglobus sp.]